MKVTCVGVGLAMWSAISLIPSATALEIGGGGSRRRDCLVTFDAAANHPATKPKQVRCVDGDAACDSDGVVNGLCSFEVAVCANSTFEPDCTLNGVQSITIENALDNGDPKFDPAFQAVQTAVDSDIQPPTSDPDVCTTPTVVLVPIKGPVGNHRCAPQRKTLKLTALSEVIDGRIYKDKDKIKLQCLPAANGCDPTVLFSGTFDRIQRQIFNQSCALSGCHDSQTQAANLLLETGASYGNLVNADPTNFAAAFAGWKRVDAPNPPGTAGDSSTSFLFRKLEGDLPDLSFGVRMPFERPKLNGTLREVIRLWIEAGAPQAGWVPGTD